LALLCTFPAFVQASCRPFRQQLDRAITDDLQCPFYIKIVTLRLRSTLVHRRPGRPRQQAAAPLLDSDKRVLNAPLRAASPVPGRSSLAPMSSSSCMSSSLMLFCSSSSRLPSRRSIPRCPGHIPQAPLAISVSARNSVSSGKRVHFQSSKIMCFLLFSNTISRPTGWFLSFPIKDPRIEP
jgi:hypothetical protein